MAGILSISQLRGYAGDATQLNSYWLRRRGCPHHPPVGGNPALGGEGLESGIEWDGRYSEVLCGTATPPPAGGGVLAFLHAANTVTMVEFSWLDDQLRESLADHVIAVVTAFVHDDWHPSRRVLG